MGRIVSKFTCVEFAIYPDYAKGYTKAHEEVDKRFHALEEFINECRFKDNFNLVRGSNDSMFFTAAPSGGKVGWETARVHEKEVKQILSLIKSVADYYTIETVTTSNG